MPYLVSFFEPQVHLARLLADRFGLALGDALLVYTAAARSLGVANEEWPAIAPPAADD